MNYRPKILLIFALLLGLMFYGAIGYTQAKTALSTEQSKSATYAEKTSSSNIHIDDIVIKNSTAAQSGNSVISEENQKILTLKLSNDAKKEFLSWIDNQVWISKTFGFTVFIAVIGFIWAFLSRTVETAVEKQVSRLENKRDETIKATIAANHEIERTKKALEELQDIENDINKKLKDFQNKISEEIKNKEEELVVLRTKADSINDNLDSITQDLGSKATDEIFRLEQKINALELIINKIDKDGVAKEIVVNELIAGLNGDDTKIKYSAAELLPQFKLGSSKVTDAFVEILKKKPDITLGSLLLSGLGKLSGDGKTLAYLLELVADINSNPNILAIIGALGELGEAEIKNTEAESIVDQLLLILQNDLDNKEFALDITASRVKGAISLALSYYGGKAEKAVKELIKLLADQDQETRKNAAIALGKIGVKAKDAIPELQKLKDDEYTEVRGAALDAIEEIQQNA